MCVCVCISLISQRYKNVVNCEHLIREISRSIFHCRYAMLTFLRDSDFIYFMMYFTKRRLNLKIFETYEVKIFRSTFSLFLATSKKCENINLLYRKSI